MTTTTQPPASAKRRVEIRPFHARVTVELRFIDEPGDARTEIDAPLVFEAAHATMMAALGSLVEASVGDPKARAAAKLYLEAIPAVFEEIANDPSRWVSWRSKL